MVNLHISIYHHQKAEQRRKDGSDVRCVVLAILIRIRAPVLFASVICLKLLGFMSDFSQFIWVDERFHCQYAGNSHAPFQFLHGTKFGLSLTEGYWVIQGFINCHAVFQCIRVQLKNEMDLLDATLSVSSVSCVTIPGLIAASGKH